MKNYASFLNILWTHERSKRNKSDMVDIMNNVFKIFLQKNYLKIEKVGQLKAGLIP